MHATIRLERVGDPTWSLTAAPAGQIPEVPPGEYRWTTEGSALLYVDTEANASSPGRTILEASGFDHDELPLPLQANLYTGWGHDGAQNVGRIESLTLDGNTVQASGVFTVKGDADDHSDPGRAAALAVALGNVRGVSVDAAMLDYTEQYEVDAETGMMVDVVYVVHSWKIGGATQTPFPAFADARLTVEGIDTAQNFADEMPDEMDDVEEEPMAASVAVQSAPPAAWFQDPMLDRPTPLTVEADGRVYGHIAPWDSPGSKSCHVGFADRCVCPPKSPDGEYPYMMSGGTVHCADGTKAQVATIAYLGGHPDDDGSQPWTTIKAAYDDPRNAGLQVAIGEDRHGIWMAGRVAPTRTQAEVEVIRACGVSGHWRTRIQGDPKRGPRMIGACCVLSEGFPKAVITAAVGDDDLPAPARGPVARWEGDELVSLVAANGTATLAAAHVPASKDDVSRLEALVASLGDDLRRAEGRLALLDEPIREAAQSLMG